MHANQVNQIWELPLRAAGYVSRPSLCFLLESRQAERYAHGCMMRAPAIGRGQVINPKSSKKCKRIELLGVDLDGKKPGIDTHIDTIY